MFKSFDGLLQQSIKKHDKYYGAPYFSEQVVNCTLRDKWLKFITGKVLQHNNETGYYGPLSERCNTDTVIH